MSLWGKANLEASLKQPSVTDNKTIQTCLRHQRKHCRFTTADVLDSKGTVIFQRPQKKCSRPGLIIVILLYSQLKGSSYIGCMCPGLKPACSCWVSVLHTLTTTTQYQVVSERLQSNDNGALLSYDSSTLFLFFKPEYCLLLLADKAKACLYCFQRSVIGPKKTWSENPYIRFSKCQKMKNDHSSGVSKLL